MRKQLPPEEDLTKEMVFFFKKMKLAFKFLFSNKAILLIDNNVDCVNYNHKELSETIEAMYFGVLKAQNKNFEQEVDVMVNDLIAC